jgi:hypothetical protein
MDWANKMVAALRTKAYMDMGWRVSGKMEARKSMAPNSNKREFQVERKCDVYSRSSNDLGMVFVGEPLAASPSSITGSWTYPS